MKKNEQPTYRDIFLGKLSGRESDYVDGYFAHIYLTLFRCLDNKELEDELKYLHKLSEGKDENFKKLGKTEWFAIWHKSIRQADYFQDIYQVKTLNLLDEKQKARLKFLRHKFYIDRAPKEGTNDKLFNDEYTEYLNLYKLKEREEKDYSISGVLDAILWDVVHIDKEGVLYKSFKETFGYFTKKKTQHETKSELQGNRGKGQ